MVDCAGARAATALVSLGVIPGHQHADAIDASLARRLRSQPGPCAAGSPRPPEPFFVKNLESVQGDERDAIIFTIGYGQRPGRPMRSLRPAEPAGGERRLNVAVTRAKRRAHGRVLFTAADMEPDKLRAEGPRRLADYLRFVAGGCRDLAGAALERPAPNPFEAQVQQRLTAEGLSVESQVGSVGYVIDFALAHPTKPGRRVLAVEADGATSTPRRRRGPATGCARSSWSAWAGACTGSGRDWLRDLDRAVARLRSAWDDAVAAASAADATDEADAALPALTELAELAVTDVDAITPVAVADPQESTVEPGVEADPWPASAHRARRGHRRLS